VTRYHVAPTVLRAYLEEHEVLLNPESGIYHVVNDTGRRLLGCWDDGLSLEESVSRLAEQTGWDPEQVRIDADGFVAAMMERGLIEDSSP
jgi:hypothetical protein